MLGAEHFNTIADLLRQFPAEQGLGTVVGYLALGVRDGIVKGAYLFRREGRKAQAGKVKLQLALGRGKRQYDKRDAIRRRDQQRELDRARKEYTSRY